jgi:hypothetical protein
MQSDASVDESPLEQLGPTDGLQAAIWEQIDEKWEALLAECDALESQVLEVLGQYQVSAPAPPAAPIAAPAPAATAEAPATDESGGGVVLAGGIQMAGLVDRPNKSQGDQQTDGIADQPEQ